jgi:acid phosphatase type 7
MKKYLLLAMVCVLVAGTVVYARRYYISPVTHHIVAVGDIAKPGGQHERVAELVRTLNPEKVLILGDIAYDDGTTKEFTELYDPSWGQFKNITAASPGNHEYHTPGAQGYYDYFDEQSAGPDRRGYYSFDLGSWHIVSLNSEVLTDTQLSWLDDDLQATNKKCILAFWHKPFFSSGLAHGNNKKMKPFWDTLNTHGADLVLNGHEHVYERFAKQNSSEKIDFKGIRQYTVGTGGADQYGFRKTIRPNSEARSFDDYGVLSLTLRDGSYDAEFVSAEGSDFTDTVTGEACND